ncbi:MAG: LysM peptidoglycan-binding domain-containing protein [Dysgonomonas sp.]
MYRVLVILAVISFSFPDTLKAQIKEETTDTYFTNPELLDSFFDKLYDLERNKTGKINIVHIGDSHIQADFLTNTIRQSLQKYFGNAGYGFTFPYSIAKTNGTKIISYDTNAEWESARNAVSNSSADIGLSGIRLGTESDNFYIKLTANQPYQFNTIKILHPSKDPMYNMALNIQSDDVNNTIKQEKSYTYHTVKKGETLYRISSKYNVSVDRIKKENRLRNNTIRLGQKIKIPRKTITYQPEIFAKDTLSLENQPYCSSYHQPDSLNQVYIMPNGKHDRYALNGFILENGNLGITYHTIGVNGAKVSDFNGCPLFFAQFSLLNADLVILSFGTNESFGKISEDTFLSELSIMINKIRQTNSSVKIIITTPPPSLLRKRQPNTLAEKYSESLMNNKKHTVWDMFSAMGGNGAIKQGGEWADLIARDKVHYSKEGYQLQGNLFLEDFYKTYNNYIKEKILNGDTIK